MSAVGLDADAALAPYEALFSHVELELELAGRGETTALVALGARWEQLLGALPPNPPQAAAPLLERATLMHERTRIELVRLRDAVLAELGSTRRAQRAADGYAGQLAPRPRLDRSA